MTGAVKYTGPYKRKPTAVDSLLDRSLLSPWWPRATSHSKNQGKPGIMQSGFYKT